MQIRPASPDTDLVLAEIVRRLVTEFQPERIYLFGSRARRDAGALALARDVHQAVLCRLPGEVRP